MNPYARSKVAFFVTGNIHKFNEARRVLAEYTVSVAMLNVDAVEIQDDSIENISRFSVIDAAKKTCLPVFVEDAGLFVDALNGFPGAYSSYVYRTIGTRGILKLMQNEHKRDAHFQSVVAFCDPQDSSEPRIFEGKAKGEITYQEKGKQGFGYDPIFQPYDKSSRTFAEMTTEEKNRHSHRSQALRKFARWFRGS